MLEKFELYFSSKSRVAAGLFVVALILAVPFTVSELSQQQDLRQRASFNQTQQNSSTPIVPAADETNECDNVCGQINPVGKYCGSGSPGANGQCSCKVCTTQPIKSPIELELGGNGPTNTPTPIPSSGGNQNTGSANAQCLAEHPGLDTEEKKMLQLINDWRAQNGKPAFANSQKLNQMASSLAEDFATHGYRSNHTDSQNRSMTTRFADCGMSPSSMSENTGSWPTTQQMFDDWKASSGHNANMLGGSAAIGIGRAAVRGGYMWANNFASPNPGGAPINDNSGGTDPTATPIKTPTPQSGGTNPTATKTPTPSVGPGTITATPPIASPTLTGTILSLVINMPGIGTNTSAGDNNNPNPPSKSGEIELLNPESGASVQKIQITLNYAGSGNFNTSFNVPTGTHNIKLKTTNSLVKDLGTLLINSGQNSTNPATIITGDLNQDNILNLLDYNLIISCFGNKSCSQKTNADLNMDGKVNEIDLNIFYSGLTSRSGD